MANYIMPPRKNKEMSTSKLKEVADPTSQGTMPTRTEMRHLSAVDVNAVDIDGVFTTLLQSLGINNISAPSADITTYEIDQLAKEIVAIRNAKDTIDGRESALKAYATEVINRRIALTGKDYMTESGYLVSPENGVKLSKEVSGGKLSVDITLLEENLDEDQFQSVTNLIHTYRTITYPDGRTVENEMVHRELNEEALEEQLKLGNIGMEQVVLSAAAGKTRTAFYVRKL